MIFTVILVIIDLAIINFAVNRGSHMLDYLFNIIIGVVSSCISSFVVIIISYYKFLKRIPEATEGKINQLLNDRLNYETTNHNSVMCMLNPNNSALSTEHHNMHRDISDIKTDVKVIRSQRDADYRLLDGAGQQILRSVDSLSDFSNLFADIYKKNIILETENRQLSHKLDMERVQNEHLKAEIKALNHTSKNRARDEWER